MNEWSRAEVVLKRLIQSKKPEYKHYLQYGYALFKQKKHDQAKKVWLDAKKLEETAEIHNNLGMIAMEKGNLSEAETHFNKAIALDSKMPLAYYNLGVMYQKQQKNQKAISAYNNALIINPNLYSVYMNLAIVYEREKNYDEAINNLNKFLKTSPKTDKLQRNDAIKRLTRLKNEKK